jgi:hypothetical protein
MQIIRKLSHENDNELAVDPSGSTKVDDMS